MDNFGVLLLGLVGGLAVGLVVAAGFLRAARRDAVLARDAAVAATAERLSAELAAERDHTVEALARQLAVEREQQVQATVDTVLAIAGDKLGAHTDQAALQLDLRSQAFDEKVAGMSDELHRVSHLVTELQKEKAEQHGQLVRGINEAIRVSAALTDTTQGLREVLSNSRARGQWGERMADDVLRAAGFVEGVNYQRQHTLEGGSRPDITFLLPRDRVLHMDVKFPLDNYVRALEATIDAEQAAAVKSFSKDVRARIKELSVRDYADPATTVGYVLLFIPNESVYAFVHEHDPGLLDEALAQRVVLCSPFSLFAVLGVVRQAVENFMLERTSDEILDCLGGFTKQWDQFNAHLERLGKQFGTAQRTYDELTGPRRNQLQKQLDRIDTLRDARGLDVPALPTALDAVNAVDAVDAATDDIFGDLLPDDDALDEPSVAVGGDAAGVRSPASTLHSRPRRLRPLR